jgi:hypothetical protein
MNSVTIPFSGQSLSLAQALALALGALATLFVATLFTLWRARGRSRA